MTREVEASVREQVEQRVESAIDLSRAIYDFDEIAWEEEKSAAAVAEYMRRNGFDVTESYAGLPTALHATRGSGSLVVTWCAEYDALPKIGHACGHNLIAASSCLAATALGALVDELDLTVELIGTPAEEMGGGKIELLRKGGFDRSHVALMAHPATEHMVRPGFIAATSFQVVMTGRQAHAAEAPERALNAADALTIGQVAIGLLRQHLPAGALVHGVILDGGTAPNVIPAHAEGNWIIRTRSADDLDAVAERVRNCFRAGALATGCEVEFLEEDAYLDIVSDPALSAAYERSLRGLGITPSPDSPMGASSDMGNVTHVIPGIHPEFAVGAVDVHPHEAEFARVVNTDDAMAAMVGAASAMALAIADIAGDPEARQRFIDRGPGPQG